MVKSRTLSPSPSLIEKPLKVKQQNIVRSYRESNKLYL